MSTSNSNVRTLRRSDNSEIYDDRGRDCCAFVKDRCSSSDRLIQVYFNIRNTKHNLEEIKDYLEGLKKVGIPYSYEFKDNEVIAEFPTCDLVNAQEGYIYFILLRYMWSTYYEGIVKRALDIVSKTNFDMFQAAQIAHHEKGYPSGHSLYYENTGCGYIYSYEEFKKTIHNCRNENVNLYFSRQYNTRVAQIDPVVGKYRNFTSTQSTKFCNYLRDRLSFKNVKSLISEGKYEEAYNTIMSENNLYSAVGISSNVSPVFAKEMSDYIDKEVLIPVKVIYENCLNYVKSLDLTKYLGIKSNNVTFDTTSTVGDLVVGMENDTVIVGVKHTSSILKVITSSKALTLTSCGKFSTSEGRLLPSGTQLWKLNVELNEN